MNNEMKWGSEVRMANAPLDDKEREDLVAYLDGEADKKTARSIEAKLSTSADARQEADALKKTWDLLDYLPRPEPSPNFTHRTMERLTVQGTRPRNWRPWFLGLGWAAAVLVAALAGFGVAGFLQQRQQTALDHQLVRELHTVEHLRTYEHVDDIDLLRKLANPNDPDLFGEESNPGS
jgi:anti-sigma factor RsiW